MRRRNIMIKFRLDETEAENFRKRVASSGLSQEAYIRTLINGRTPQPILPEEFVHLMNEVSALKAQVTVLRDELLVRGQYDAADQLEQLRQDVLQEMRRITETVSGG